MEMFTVPEGFHFDPTDEQLIMHYLLPKVNGADMSWASPDVTERDLYGEEDPWDLFVGTSKEILYFFTQVRKKFELGKKVKRTVGKDGKYCWMGQDSGCKIIDRQSNRVIGFKKLYSLTNSGGGNNKKRKIVDGCSFIMHEYSLILPVPAASCDPSSTSMASTQQQPTYVLCRIRKKGGKDK